MGSIPDSFVISLSPSPVLWVVENELAKHPVYEHIISQLGKFMNAMRQPAQRIELIDRIYKEIESDPIKEATIRKSANPKDIYKFVSDLVSKPQFVVIIDELQDELEDACAALPNRPEVITLKTYLRDLSNSSIHACVFDSLVHGKLGGVARTRVSITSGAGRRVEGAHFTQRDFEREILDLLSKETRPLSTKEIIEGLRVRLEGRRSEADKAPVSAGRIRWEATARFAIYQGLKKKGLITAKSKNQWVLAQKV